MTFLKKVISGGEKIIKNEKDFLNSGSYSQKNNSFFEEKKEKIFKIKNEWMTTNEAAIYLRKSANAIRTMVCRGQIKARKFRRRLYFNRSELDKLIETSEFVGG
jgi:excisionase family DNA binding protein